MQMLPLIVVLVLVVLAMVAMALCVAAIATNDKRWVSVPALALAAIGVLALITGLIWRGGETVAFLQRCFPIFCGGGFLIFGAVAIMTFPMALSDASLRHAPPADRGCFTKISGVSAAIFVGCWIWSWFLYGGTVDQALALLATKGVFLPFFVLNAILEAIVMYRVIKTPNWKCTIIVWLLCATALGGAFLQHKGFQIAEANEVKQQQ